VASSFCSVISRAGGALAPQILQLSAVATPLPFVVFFVVALMNTISFVTFIPETKFSRLPDRMPAKSEWWCRAQDNAEKERECEADPLTIDKLKP
jgi:hypothetical protein